MSATKNAQAKRVFEVSCAFKVEIGKDRFFDRKGCKKTFFAGPASAYKKKIGCYVFSLRNGRGFLPYYVGKTTNSFEGEVLEPHKISDHYQRIVKDRKGSPEITFVALKSGKGPKPDATIRELERHLIQMAYLRNSKLSNRQGLPKTRWSISGIVEVGKGRPCEDVRNFKRLMGYE